MKPLIACFLLLTAVTARGEFKLAWDAPSSGPTPDGYRLYAHTNAITSTNLAASTVRLDAGTNTTARIADIAPGRWHFVATSVITNGNAALESAPSVPLIVDVPEKPDGLRTVYLQFNATVSGTNWQNAGYFRVRFE